jgi:hypothetical protein
MPRLLAVVPRDAWAFVQDGEQTVCVFPPFVAASRRVVPPEAVAAGISLHGYRPVEAVEEAWPEVIARVRQEAHRDQAPTDAQTFSEQALANLPRSSLEGVVQRIEARAREPHLREAAQRALERVMEHPRVRGDDGLHALVRDALHRVRDELARQQRARDEAVLHPRILEQRKDPLRRRRCEALHGGRAGLAELAA